MRRVLRPRFWLESGLGLVTIGLAILTLTWHNWIELTFHVQGPWHGKGYLEKGVVVVCLVVFLLTTTLARVEWQRAARRTQPAEIPS